MLDAGHPSDYLGADDVIQSGHPDVVALAQDLRRDHPDDEEFGAAAFEWVRDQVAHALDVQDRRVTLTAVEVLRERVGLCYAKSHLVVRVLMESDDNLALCAGGLPSEVGAGERTS